MEVLKGHPFNDDGGRAGAGDFGAHGVEHVGQVLNLGFARRVFDDGLALGRYGAHHGVFGGAHAGKIERNIGAVQAVRRAGVDIAVVGLKVHAQGVHANHMHVNLAGTQVATARHSHARLAEASHERPQNRDGGAHLGHQLIGRFPCVHMGGVHRERMALARHASTQLFKHFGHHGYV